MEIRKILFISVASLALLCCTNVKKGYRTPLEDSLLQRVDDSIRLQSPQMKEVVQANMAAAKDSVTYYEFYLRNSYVCFLYDQPDSMRYYADRTLDFAFRQKERTPRIHDLIGLAYMIRAAECYHFKSNPDSVFYFYNLALEHITRSCDQEKLPNLCANIADAYQQINNVPKAAYWYRRALFLSDSLNMPVATNVSINMGLAQVYLFLSNYESAQECYRHTEEHYNEMDRNMQTMFLNNYGNFFYFKKDYRNALKYFRKAKTELEKTHPQSIDLNICYLNMADVYLNLGIKDSATAYLNRCTPFFVKNKVDVAIYYCNTVRIGLALADDNLRLAKTIIEGEKVAPPNEPNMTNIRNGYLRRYYSEIGNYKEAYRLLSDNVAANDTLEQNKTHMRAAEIMMRFQQDTLALHHQINIQAKDKEVRTAYTIVAFAVIVIVVIILLYIIITRRRKLEGQVRILQLRLTNVRNRISPHFIFNVLNNIINKNEKINSEDLLTVTQFIRTGLDMSRHIYVTLKQEIDFTCQYVYATKNILDEDFFFKIEKPDDETLNSIQIPSMFIQILAENSIKHALMGKEGRKELSIIIRHDSQTTDIAVIDNGPGFSVSSIGSNSTRTGLNVIRQTIFIVNQNSKKKISFNIHNVTNDAGVTIGCKAELHIPSGMELTEKYQYE